MAQRDGDNDAIDELYQVPLNEFTAKRNALVKALRGADATHVRKLSKPSVVAWAVNQVYWRARSTYDRLIKSGERLRKAQIAALEGKKADVRDASDGHRRAVADAVAEAERLAGAAGSHPGTDALMRTFEALSLAAELPEHPGRLTDALQPAGFEALAGVTPKAPPPPAQHAAVGSTAPAGRHEAGQAPTALHPARDTQTERERQRNAAADSKRRAAEEKARQTEIRKRQAAVDQAKADEARARADWQRAQEALHKAEENLAAIK